LLWIWLCSIRRSYRSHGQCCQVHFDEWLPYHSLFG
jgi:hypothetical protein